jgi:hypothetical protein
MMRLRAFVFSAWLFAIALPVLAQTVNLENNRIAVTELAGPWRFHPGDDPASANPGFDDSAWPLIKAGVSWDQQGYAGYGGVAWYRLAIALPAHPGHLAFYLRNVSDSYQVFANGRLIGQVGGMPPQPQRVIAVNMLFQIPDNVLIANEPLFLAIRVWHKPTSVNPTGGITATAIGSTQALAGWRELQFGATFHRQVSNLIDVYLDLLTALAGFGLYWLRRKEREYLWWGISQLLWAAFIVNLFMSNFRPTVFLDYGIAWGVLFTLASLFQLKFYVVFLRQRYGWLFRGAIFFLLAAQSLRLLGNFTRVSGMAALANDLCSPLMQICVLGMLWIGARRRTFGALLLLVAYCASFSADAASFVSGIPFFAASHWASVTRLFINQTFNWPFPISAYNLTGDFEMFAVVMILVLSYARSRRDEERLESELEAARTVQKILIPHEVPAIPGFQVEAVYKPASQVGGDFFQIIATKSGGVLIVIGDVSGKGMPAAMTVSLLVGTFRTLAHYTQSPAEILRAMNQRMLARSDGGFTTCLVLRADRDGSVTTANAGHLAPYLGGGEVSLEYGLPLGLSAESTYNESHFDLREGEELTLLTDGVPEARNAAGELLGFDSTAALSSQHAEAIAETAHRFGQDDDVTIVKLALEPAQTLRSPAPLAALGTA